ncbi:putative protein N(5)-glutamine methyltransferase [Salsipaludibacter albus]|uniref:putative protein N(5)-glutamine methyltransferase n=1 Tax=Salsipaludibacter albus TaxID=2849650 RepID=UPI001EE3FB51|nr:putative protein N(5)-glutamine methyltransferase [Salsipaludibacter albus]MBY5163405.1 putative protein N(5)-glutamine methyltransferase [Salsipaludibacter albus]
MDPSTARSDDRRAAIAARLRAAGCVFAEREADLLLETSDTPAELERMLASRIEGRPLEQVVGWASFLGLRVGVTPGVFVPRRRTELLVREAAALARPGAVVVDLCCGSGAVGLAIATAVPAIRLWAVDVDPVAVRCARDNLPADAEVARGDLLQALPPDLQGWVDLVAVNAPYVPTAAIALLPREARLHEPVVALDGGSDGLDVQRRVLAEVGDWLAPGGAIAIETSRDQVGRTVDLVQRRGLWTRVVTSDELEATVVVGERLAVGESPGARRSDAT